MKQYEVWTMVPLKLVVRADDESQATKMALIHANQLKTKDAPTEPFVYCVDISDEPQVEVTIETTDKE